MKRQESMSMNRKHTWKLEGTLIGGLTMSLLLAACGAGGDEDLAE